jgi:hypothetical protein
MKNEWKRLDTEIPVTSIDYVRIEDRLDGHLSVFVRVLHDQSLSRQFEIGFQDYGAFQVIGEHVPHRCGKPDRHGNIFEINDSDWIVEVGLSPNSVYGGTSGLFHFVVLTESFTVDVASSAKPVIREVAPLNDEELKQLTKGPTTPPTVP